jgi:transposase InsO family protein
MAHYKSYHTNIKLLAVNNLLPTYYKKHIPASTLSTWKNNTNTLNQIVGIDSIACHDDFVKMIHDMGTHKILFRCFRAIWLILHTYSDVLHSIENRKKILLRNKTSICSCIQYLVKMIGVVRACKVFGVSPNQYYYWKKSFLSCSSSSLKLCRKTYNHQLLETEIEVIKRYFTFNKYLFWPITSVYHQILRDKAAFFSISTCYNYLNLLGIKRIKTKHRRKHHKKGLRASAPLELLHMDVSIFKTINNAKVYLYVICDNFSRCILAYKISTKFDVGLVLENIKEVKRKYSLFRNTKLIVDNGIENRTQLLDDFLDNAHINKNIAQLHITESNSMVESVFRQLKYYHIYPKKFETAVDFINEIDFIVLEHCNRPLHVLNGLTPLEALEGKIPSKHALHYNMVRSRVLRVETNRKNACGVC